MITVIQFPLSTAIAFATISCVRLKMGLNNERSQST